MHDVLKIIDSLENKINQLIERQSFLKEENELLRDQLHTMQKELVVKKQLTEEQEEQLNSLKIAKTIQGSEDYSKETTQKINTLVKEIDWCIAHLSD